MSFPMTVKQVNEVDGDKDKGKDNRGTVSGVKEVIIVEGRNDLRAVREAFPGADVIETHGFGITEEKLELIAKAYAGRGILILTDPDHAGENIRRKLKERFPEAKEAFLTRSEAEKKGDIGVENATGEDIRKAVEKARARLTEREDIFSPEDLFEAGLAGRPGAAKERQRMGKALGIGYGNAGAFLRKLNGYGVTKEEFNGALRSGKS